MSRESQIETVKTDGRDAVFLQSRRELIGILVIWVSFALWVVVGAGALGYQKVDGELDLVFGMPSWVFWAVGVPWFVANIVIVWFCTGFMKDQPLDSAEADDTVSDSNR